MTDRPGATAFRVNARDRIALNGQQAGTGNRLTRLQFAMLIFLGWTVFGLLISFPEMLTGFQWPVFLNHIIDAWSWALLTPAFLLIDRKLVARQSNIVSLVLVLLLLSVPITLAHLYLTGLLLYPIPQITWSPLRDSSFVKYYFVGGWVNYCAVVAALQAFRFYSRFERAERSLLKWRLNALRLHLEPHFLFNALNAISSEVVKRPQLAQDMIADLGALLRLSLDLKDSPEITLAQELALLDRYLSIQKIRFGRRIDIKVEARPETLSARVPTMLLQPLVENAIRHGIEGRRSGGEIIVSASRAGNRLQLSVADNGRGLPKGWKLESSTGHGLSVTLERLIALYPECREDCLEIERRAGGGTEVIIRLPFYRGE